MIKQSIIGFLTKKNLILNLITLIKTKLKYGENPNQKSFFYKENKNTFFEFKFHGKEIGYNNILDLNSGIDCLKEFSDPTCVIIKHNNPCGVASRKTIKDAFTKAYEADSLSAFGGIVTLNRNVDKSLAQILSKKFFEIIAAPSFSSNAKEILQQKKNLILINTKKIKIDNKQDIKSVAGGYLVQDKNNKKILKKELVNVSSINIKKNY